jgi:hypothetical protein
MSTNGRWWFGPLILSMLFVGCQPKGGRQEVHERQIMYTSFEELAGWYKNPPINLVTEKARTGKYAVRVDTQSLYSPTYRVRLGDVCGHRPRRLTVSAWVWVPKVTDDAVIVVAVTDPNNRENLLLRKTIFLTDSGPYSKWKKVSRSFEMPGGIRSNSELVVYLWHSDAKDPVYADDFSVTELW